MTEPTPLEGEPTFSLMARDPFAPALVRLWATQRRLDVRNGTRPVSDLDQIERAERTAERMEDWRRNADEAWKNQPQLPLDETKADDDGWIMWDGGDRPVSAKTLVQVEYADGASECDRADEYDWTPGGGIAKYSVLF